MRNIACRIAHAQAIRRVAAAQRRTSRAGEALDQRRQAFNEQYRDADAENDAEYA